MTVANVLSLIAIAISVIVGGTSIYFNSKNSKHTETKDNKEYTKERIEEIKERTKENAMISGKLDLINLSNQEIKEQISSLVKKVESHGDKLARAEEAIKRNDNEIKRLRDRVDSMEEKIGKEDKE